MTVQSREVGLLQKRGGDPVKGRQADCGVRSRLGRTSGLTLHCFFIENIRSGGQLKEWRKMSHRIFRSRAWPTQGRCCRTSVSSPDDAHRPSG